MTSPSAAKIRTRLFVADDLDVARALELRSEQAHLLRNVLRCQSGDRLALFNGRDGEWEAVITEIGKSRCVATVDRRRRAMSAGPDVWLVFAPIKRTRIDALVEKAVELGVARLVPVWTENTMIARVNDDRLRAHTIEAAEQCERLDVPELLEAMTLDAVLSTWPPARRLWVMAETGVARPIAEAMLAERGQPCEGDALLTGPEGGFTDGELRRLAAYPFARLVGLGPRILRAETAALAALSCFQAILGDGAARPSGR